MIEKVGGSLGSRWVCCIPESHVDRLALDISNAGLGRGWEVVSRGLVDLSKLCQVQLVTTMPTVVSLQSVLPQRATGLHPGEADTEKD